MKVSKTYRLKKRFFLQFKLRIGDDLVLVEFPDGKRHTKPVLNGSLVTTNVRLQKALENHPFFNSKYVLESEIQVEDGPDEDLETRSEEINPEPKEEEDVPVRLTKVSSDEVSTVQQAKDYLIEKYKVTHNSVSNRDKVIQVAKEQKVFFEGIDN